MADTATFAKLVPGFDFLQGLVKNAGSAIPSIGQWVAPTLNPEELEKRIEELRTVQFWLEQNARMLGATIQALEVQRMTLSTLKTMNVQLNDLRDSLTLKPFTDAKPGAKAAPPPAPSVSPAEAAKKAAAPKKAPAPAPAATMAGVMDPMQAWNALFKQFTQIGATAMKDMGTDATKNLATTMMKQSIDAAGETLKNAMTAPVKAASKVAGTAASTAVSAAGAAAKVAKAARTPAASPKPAAKKSAARKTRKAATPPASAN